MLINNRIYNIDTNSRHWAISLALIVILSVIMTFIPFVGLCLSLMFFRQGLPPFYLLSFLSILVGFMSHKWICWFIMSIFIVLPTNHWLSNGWTLEHQNMAKKYILYYLNISLV